MPDESEPDPEQDPEPSEPPEASPARQEPAASLSDVWTGIQRAYGAQIAATLEASVQGLASNVLDTARLGLPFLPDLGKLLAETSGYNRSVDLAAEAIKASTAGVRAQALAPTLALLRTRLLPANLRQLDDVSFKRLGVVADDGITLYAVPRAAIAKRILAASDMAARRRILGSELPRILDDCETVLDRCVAPGTRGSVVFARKAIAAARAGHLEAAQALVANTLDTAMYRSFVESERVGYTSHKIEGARSKLDKLAVRRFMVFVPIWRAYARYTPGQADPTPWTFNRHVTSHAVNARQFNRPNMAQGVMLLTALIALLNDL